MSIKIFAYGIEALWSEAEEEAALRLIPVAMQQRIISYQQATDRQARLVSRLLLRKLLTEMQPSLSLDDVKFTPHHKPYVDSVIDFSITHTNGLVACAVSVDGPIGLDAERIRPVDITDYADTFTDGEKRWLQVGSDHSFWHIWTRKEAIAKASGLGIQFDFEKTDVVADMVVSNGISYRLKAVDLGAEIVAHVAICGELSALDQPVEIIWLDSAALLAVD